MLNTADDPGRVLVIVPTFNELDTLPRILDRIRVAVPTATVLVVDDASPDGTGALAERRSAADPLIDVLHRREKDGLGPAYFAGFRWGIERGFDVLVQMDADGSHAPEELERLLAALTRADVVIGSRYVQGGAVVNWPKSREFLSRGGNWYSRLALGVPIRDITAGYRAYRADVIMAIPLDEVASRGYCFQVDLAWRAIRAGFDVAEVPITFTERELGVSKMSGGIVREALWKVTLWGLRYRWQQLRYRSPAPLTGIVDRHKPEVIAVVGQHAGRATAPRPQHLYRPDQLVEREPRLTGGQ